ncbi:MAG: hypothetical protein JOY90_06030 [Bradyrhizobium sp.]|uniref:hypothetical protein n=1 Tax=Bradyrhizobium sp. TaxID=376 RepID=UPI001DC320D2|nr:hypothetical protein [Bradyrhizobium sp.]MBV9560007.1 hypothetical protein [Bradyrhizobium sp.]
MRLLLSLLAIIVLDRGAFAAQQDCKTIADSALRLTCYDKINPPIATYPIPLPKPAYGRPAPSPAADTVNASDPDDAAVTEKMRSICRGC